MALPESLDLNVDFPVLASFSSWRHLARSLEISASCEAMVSLAIVSSTFMKERVSSKDDAWLDGGGALQGWLLEAMVSLSPDSSSDTSAALLAMAFIAWERISELKWDEDVSFLDMESTYSDTFGRTLI